VLRNKLGISGRVKEDITHKNGRNILPVSEGHSLEMGYV
jgi:hypothetical protein